jgi:hypothetical protein
MTAAVIPSTLPPPDPSAAVRQVGDPRHDRPIGRKARGTPYLAPVPDCEPPFDDEVCGPHPARSWQSAAPARAFHHDDARPSPGPDTEPGAGAALLRGDPNSTIAAHNDAATQIDTATHIEHAARAIDAGTATGVTRPHRAPRPARSPGLRHRAQADVLLLEQSRTAPTTILAQGVPPWSSEADIGVRKTASEDLPPAQRVGSVLARALVEVLSGQRPLAQLRVHCAPEIYAGLGNRAAAPRLALPHLLTVRVCEPADGVAEVSVAFRRADRVKALAFRIEGVDGRWRITALQLG